MDNGVGIGGAVVSDGARSAVTDAGGFYTIGGVSVGGYTVVAARSAEEALRQADARAAEIRLLVTDVVMPEMNGRDLARQLAARHPHIGHLFMSGYTADVVARQGMLEDGTPLVQKPFSRETLAFKVREALERRP